MALPGGGGGGRDVGERMSVQSDVKIKEESGEEDGVDGEGEEDEDDAATVIHRSREETQSVMDELLSEEEL